MAFDIDEARKSGYSDDEIASYMSQQNNYDYQGAKNAGYSTQDILNHLSSIDTSLAGRQLREESITKALKTGAGEGLQTALPSSSAFDPLKPTSDNPVIGGAQTALQTLRDPTRISPTMSQPGQALSQSKVGQSVAQAGENMGVPKGVTDFVTQVLADPQTYIGLEPGKLPKGIQNQLSSLGETLSGVDKRNFMELANNPMKVLSAQPSSVTGKALQAAKEAAGVTEEQERQLFTKEDFRRSIYNDTLSKIDQATAQPGDKFTVSAKGLPDQTLTYKGPMVKDTPESLKAQGVSEDVIKSMQQGLYDLSDDVPGHPAKSSVSATTLENLGYNIADKSDISVSDLLRAKKAGQLMAQTDPSSSGFIQREIHGKINPLLQEMAPDVYNAQQANHLSQVKEAFTNLFPGGKGMYKYIRTIGMLGGSLFHGIGLAESPIVAGTATIAGSQAAKAALSPTGLMTIGKGLQYPFRNSPDLQSLRDRLNNAQEQ